MEINPGPAAVENCPPSPVDWRARRWALGLALGMLIGVLPKDSLLPWVLTIGLMCTTANLMVAFVSACAFTGFSHFWEALAHPIGGMMLAYEKFEWFWVALFELPLMPWTRFNNTVVMGNLVLGLICFVPLYILGCLIFTAYGSQALCIIRENRWYAWCGGFTRGAAKS
ncbi:MAG: TIGR03546 family protein [Pirellulaceae bacterium]|nr:TIGR03546 family protein [Pirellulaceae bacterium]